MTTLVLCDGSEGSLRSIEVACAGNATPSSSMPSQEGSLLLLHVWDAPVTRTSILHPSVGAEGMYAPRRSVSSAAAAAAHTSAGAGEHGGSSMPCADVLTTTLRYIHSNKYLKNKLHYTLALRQQARQIDTAAEISAGNSNNTGGGTAPERQEAPVSIPENEKRAMAVVKFATARAAHHHVTAVLLGVGQRQDGKVCTVGAVAQGVLLELRSLYPLYYVKKDGVKWRPALSTSTTTAAATPRRFTIVVTVPSDARWESAAAAETRSANEEVAPQTTASIETPSVAPPQVPMHVQETVAATVQYLQTRCMRLHSAPQVEPITFAVIATSSSQDGDSITEPDRSENSGHVAAGPGASGGEDGSTRISPLEAYKRYLESLPFVECKSIPPANAAAPPLLPVSSINPAAVGEADRIEQRQQPEDGAAAMCVEGSATMAPAPRGAASPVRVCMLKASKKNPLLSLDSEPEVALPQIIKQVGSLKPEVLVMPKSLVPESLQLALLATSNPHCIVLPF
ncbi:hypothetical protein CGC20_30755 [Leishmania donovani]|uniref:Uncharacterized protein n=1 Tax=Leishmania donovani TaxID=5661 RepID=A0A504WSX3_LEIDO|nr:hypothetical protein CGC20_30755 [Leishmania donovani]